MSAPQADLFSLLSISFVVDSHALILVTPAKVRASRANTLDCGVNTCESFASFDPESRSWKTYQRSLLGGLESFSGTWPRRGCMRSGAVFEQVTSARRTCAIDSSFWPTPTSHDAKDTGAPSEMERHTPALRAAVGGPLNVEWVAALQGFPPDWCSLPDGPRGAAKRKPSGSPRVPRLAAKTERQR